MKTELSSQHTPKQQRILIVLLGALGDICRAIALLEPLKQALPDSHITWLCSENWKPVLALHPQVDSLIGFQKSGGLSEVLRVRKQLRESSFDLTLDLQRHFKSGFFSYCSGAKRRIGFHPSNSKEYNWIFNTEYIVARSNTYPKILHYHDFLQALSIPWDGEVEFGWREEIEKLVVAEQRGEPGKTLGILLGSSWKSKDWTHEGYQKLIEHFLRESDYQLVLLGDARQQQLANKLPGGNSCDRIQNLVGKTSLKDLVAWIATCKAVVGPDSGPGHIAAAVGVPYIGLFGPTDPRRVAPWGSEQYAVLAGVRCSPCLKKVCPGLGNICMKEISVPEIIKNIEKAFD